MIQCHLASLYGSRLLTSFILTWLLLASQSSQDEVKTNYQVTNTNSKESIKVGNTKTQNFNIRQDSYLPTQLTQVVLNVPKLKKTLRKSRPPTEEEFLIKSKILDVYEEAKKEATGGRGPELLLNLDHLGRILQALNPKYIATERVRRVAFADPANPGAASDLPPLLDSPASLNSIELNSQEPLVDQLDTLIGRLRDSIHWDQDFIQLISNSEQLTPEQLAIKSLLLCLNDSATCNQAQPAVPVVEQQVVKQEEPIYTSESKTEDYYVNVDNDQQAPIYQEPPPEVVSPPQVARVEPHYQEQPVAEQYQQIQPENQNYPSPYLGSPVEPPAQRAQRFIQRYPQPRFDPRQAVANNQPNVGNVLTRNGLNNYDNRLTRQQPAFAFRPQPAFVNRPQQRPQPQPQQIQYQYEPQWQQRQPVQRPYLRY